jgi:hypothetical protein
MHHTLTKNVANRMKNLPQGLVHHVRWRDIFFGEERRETKNIAWCPFLLYQSSNISYEYTIHFTNINLIYNSNMCETISNDTDSLKLKQVHIKKSNLIHRKEGDVIGLRDQGYPGFLTEKEYEIFVSIPFIRNSHTFFSAIYFQYTHESALFFLTDRFS